MRVSRMRGRLSAVWIITVLLVAFAIPMREALSNPSHPRPFTATEHIAAQEMAREFPQGVSVASLVETTTKSVPAAPAVLRLDRLTLGPGWSGGQQTATGPILLYVESGTLSIVDELGVEGAYPQNSQLVVPMGARFTLRNDGQSAVSVLRLALFPAAQEPSTSGTPAVPGSPVVVASPQPGSAVVTNLLRSPFDTSPPTPAHLFVVRLTWAPGSVLPPHTFSGPVGIVGEQGVLTVAGPSGIEGQLRPGKAVLFPTGLVNRARNVGTDQAVVLLAGLAPANQPLIVPVDGTPAAGAPVAPTASATTAQLTTSAAVPMFRGNAARTGEMPGPGPTGAPTLRWKFDTGGKVESSPAIVGNTLYVGTDLRVVLALDLATGQKLWSFVGADQIISSPAVADGVVYVGSSSGQFYAIDAKTGHQRWQIQEPAPIYASPLVVRNTVYITDWSGKVRALDTSSGKERWEIDLGGPALASPAMGDDGVLYAAATTGGHVVAVDPATGKVRWTFTSPGDVWTTPAVVNGVVYVATDQTGSAGTAPARSGASTTTGADTAPPTSGTSAPTPPTASTAAAGGGYVEAIDAGSGQELWRFAATGPVRASAAVVNGTVYVGTLAGYVQALDTKSGNELWRFNAGGEVRSSPAVAGGVVYVTNNSVYASADYVHAIDAKSGQERWRYGIGSGGLSSPAVIGGFVYVGSDSGTIYAVGGNAGQFKVTPTPVPLTQGATVVLTADSPLRAAPSPIGVVIANLMARTHVKLTGPSEQHGGKVWWPVQVTSTGQTGYLPADVLRASGAGAAPTAGAASGTAASAGPITSVLVDLEDIKFVPSDLTIPANTNVQITLRNKGALPHNFSVDSHNNPNVKNLNISVNVDPGQTKEVTVNAPPGDNYFYCNVPGHEAAGMHGTMHVT